MDADVVGSFQKKVVQHPEVFFTPSEDIAQEIKGFTKHVFDHCTKFVSRTAATPLDQLYVDGFDADQIWEQLRLQNGPLLEELSKRIRSFQKKPEQIRLFPSEKDGQEEEDDEAMEVSEEVDEVDDDGEQESADSDDDQDDGEEEEQDDSAEKTPKRKVSKKAKKARDVAEDGFFDWDEMDRIAEEEEEEDDDDEDEGLGVDGLDGNDDDEEEGMDDDSEDDDMEDEDLDDESAAQMKFDDFFEEPDVKKSKRRRADDDEDEEEDDDDEEEEDEEEEEEDEEEDEFPTVNRTAAADVEGEVDEDELAERGIMSSHQRQRKRLQQEIKQLEKEALEDKPWELKGEVRSGARPENSLLEAVLDYDRPVKVAPVITVEVSVALEDMIKKRILEDDFDDVIRKFAPNEEDEKKKLLDVSMEKSKEGLGEIYEKEYMKTAMGFEADDESKQEQEEIEVMFKSLCWKLDALSNYQFTPKPMVKELQVKPSVPAIAMEEVVPISVSDANLKAPEEVFQKKRKRGEAVLQSKEEMTQDERKAQRGAKKRVRRKEKKQAEADERLVAKINPGLGNKYEKKKMLESIANAKNVTQGKEIEGSTKQFSNSKEFFSRLQEEVQGEIRKKKNAGAAT